MPEIQESKKNIRRVGRPKKISFTAAENEALREIVSKCRNEEVFYGKTTFLWKGGKIMQFYHEDSVPVEIQPDETNSEPAE
jgi:hypothetical protein